jgi:hypothetical protein
MSYLVTTYDNETYTVNDTNASRLMGMWMTADKPFPVNLGDATINSGTIKSIKPVKVTEADIPKAKPIQHGYRLASGKLCIAQYSIQKEINRVAQDEGGENWDKLIKDDKWREKTRIKLWQSSGDWCDHKKGTCACE